MRGYIVCHSQQSDQVDQVRNYTVILRKSLIKVYTICHSKQTDQGLQCLPFSAVWSRYTMFAILSSLITVYTICHSQQSDQGLDCLTSQQFDQCLQYLPFSVWSGSTLFAFLSLIRVFTICISFQLLLSRSTLFAILRSLFRVYTICHSQSDQGLNCLLLSALWSGTTLFAILSLIRVYIFCHYQQSDQGLHYFPFILSIIIKVYTVCHF